MTGGFLPIDLLVAGGFYTFSLLAIAGAVGVVVARRIFHSALFLVLTLANVSAVFVILGADFLAAVQVLVYVGAIMVLILFGIMLTPQNVDLPDTGGPGRAVAGVAVAAAFACLALGVLLTGPWPHLETAPKDLPTTELIGSSLFNTFGLPFEVASVLLLVAMIGALVIAREE